MKKLLAMATMVATMIIMTTSVFAGANVKETIANGVKSGLTTIDLTQCNATTDEVVNTFKEMFNTDPVMANLDGSFQCAYKGDKATTITVGYVSTATVESTKTVDEMINDIAAEAKTQGSKAEQAKYVHDYLINVADYDYTYTKSTIYDLLVNGQGTCNAYAMTYKSVMDKLGIECVIVVQNDGKHAWNQINVDGNWYNVDVTWDENYTQGGTPDTTFFMKSDDFFATTEHNAWTSANKCA